MSVKNSPACPVSPIYARLSDESRMLVLLFAKALRRSDRRIQRKLRTKGGA